MTIANPGLWIPFKGEQETQKDHRRFWEPLCIPETLRVLIVPETYGKYNLLGVTPPVAYHVMSAGYDETAQ
jgi:hypothetical protein